MVIKRTAIAVVAAAALGAPAAPAGAQSPDRIRDVAHARAATVRVERYQRPDRREEQTERFTKTVRVGSNGELDIANLAGDIVVTRGGGNDAKIDVVKTARANSADEAKQMLELVKVDITERAGRAEIRAAYPRNEGGPWNRRRNVSVSVAFTIEAPAGTRVTAKSMSGSVSVRDIKGEVMAESLSGDVEVAGGGRVAAAKTMSGDVQILDTQGEGTLDAASLSGGVTLRKVKVRRLDVQSVSGTVVLADVTCERATVQSISGDVRFDGPLARNGRYELKSHSGELRVTIPAGSGFELDANTFSGDLRTDFPIQGEIANRQQPGPRHRAIQATYGDGGAVLALNTFSGNIVIIKK